jgi:5'-3' exonuclease
MAILIDLNQVVISGLQSQLRSNKINVLNKDLCRHLVLNSIRAIVHKFKNEYGQVIICCDNKKYWRKEVFPFYKASRKKLREKSDMDWDLIFDVLGEVRADLKSTFPYKVVEVERAEADDVIGTLVPRLAAHEPILIASSDGDFKQLHQYGNVKQYNPMLGVFIKSPNPQLELKEKILTGDSGDGIPSVLSNDNVFVEGIRQKPLTAKKKTELLSLDFNDPNIECYRNISRNKLLIDLTMIPQDIKENIVAEYEADQPGNKQLLMKYFIEKKLIRLLEYIDEF